MLAWLLVVLSFTLDRWMQLSQGHPPPPLLVATADSAPVGHNISQRSDNILSLFWGVLPEIINIVLYLIMLASWVGG